MKKIYILSYSNTSNYGGLLQQYALSKILSAVFDVEVIRYKNKSNIQRSLFRKALSILYNSVFKILSVDKKRKKNEFIFRTLIPFTKDEYGHADEVCRLRCDYFIVGSDQVWNPYLNGFDKTYLLDFQTDAKKISYSASFGVEKIPDEWTNFLKTALSHFSHLSFRERTGYEMSNLLEPLKGIRKTIDLDPTLLITKSEWIDDFCHDQLIKDEYILVYLMPGDKLIEKKMLSFAKNVSKKERCKIVVIGRRNIDKYNPFKNGYYHAGPSEFVNIIFYSKYVITNSFHGTAFSVNLNKPFTSFINSKQSSSDSLKSRIVDFLRQVGLTNRIFDIAGIGEQSAYEWPVDFDESNRIIELLREESISNLMSDLKYGE